MTQPMPLQPRDQWPSELDNKLPKYFAPAELVEDFFTDDELDALLFQVFKTFTRHRHYNGGTFKLEKFDNAAVWKMLYPKLKEKFEWLREDDLLDGNAYITATNYALHMDSCNPSIYFNNNQIAVKSFLVPLFVCKPDNNKDASFVLFKNRLLGWECNFSNGSTNDVKMAFQKNVTSYDDLPWLDADGNSMKLDTSKLAVTEEVYNDHLKHLPKETCYGMELESIQAYKPNSILIFDPYQPHATGDKDWSKTKLKGGIRFNIQRKIENL
jgi:hypothetical protein